MSSDLTSVLFTAVLATLNPTLLAAVAVMLVMTHPKRLMLGYLLGAYLISMGVGMAVIFALHDSEIFRTSRHTLSPGADIVVGALALALARLVAKERDVPVRKWRASRKERKAQGTRRGHDEPWHVRLLSRGSPRVTFLVGIVLSFPGVSYLSALRHIDQLNPGALPAILLVVFFCLMQQLLIEVPLVAYAVAPDWTPSAVGRSRAWLRRKGRSIAVYGLIVVGLLLIARGIISLS